MNTLKKTFFSSITKIVSYKMKQNTFCNTCLVYVICVFNIVNTTFQKNRFVLGFKNILIPLKIFGNVFLKVDISF